MPEPTPEEEATTIIVTAPKPKPNTEIDIGGDFSPFIPGAIYSVDWESAGPEIPVRVPIFYQDGKVVFRFLAYGIDLKIPVDEWNAMTDAQRRTLTYTLQHYEASDRLKAALAHYANEGVAEIELRYGPQGWNHDGSTHTFKTLPDGRLELAVVSSDPEPGDNTGTDLRPGSRIIISINSANPDSLNMNWLAEAIIHELLHPWVPDTLQPDGSRGDHDRLNIWDTEEYNDIFSGTNPSNLPPGAETGIGYLGSRYSDSDIGTVGNDVMVGMGGDDILNGLSGDDVLAGGAGMDTLTAGTGFSDLRGGLDADTYIASVVDASFFLEDSGGVDRLKIAGSGADFIVARNGDNLTIWSNSQGYVYEVVDHYVDGKRIEIFEFSDGEYSASYLEYLAEGSGGPGVCYQDGWPVICGQYGMPVVIDLDGDGVELVEAGQSKVRMDVDGDGLKERVGWTNGDDAFLVLDRNGNGRIDSFSELSFLADFRGAGSDLEGLLAYDDNGDGFLTAADSVFAKLQLWRDANSDGVSQKGEMLSLADAGIVSIGLEIRDLEKLDQDLALNQVLGRTGVGLTDGSSLTAYDVGLYFEVRDHGFDKNGPVSWPYQEPQPLLVPDAVI